MKNLMLLLALAATLLPAFADSSLIPQKPIELTGTHGKFDFIKVDATQRRLLACHTGNASLDVIDIDKSTLIKSIPTGNAQGVAIDEKGGRYFVSCSKPPKLVIIDSTKLEVTGEVPLPGPADICAYVPGPNIVLVDNDEKPETWMIDPEAKKITKTLTYQGTGMEDLGVSSDGQDVVQNLKDTSQIAILDMQTGQVTATWPTSPAEKPHGLARVKDDAVLVAGGTGKLALISVNAGTVLASCDITPRVDEMAYDSTLGRAYCASGTGKISVVFVSAHKLTPLETVTSAPGAHSIAVDPKKHTVWIVYAKGDQPVAQAFTEQ